MKSLKLNPARYILKQKLKVHTASVMLRNYRRLIVRYAAQGLVALCEDLGVDQVDRETISRRAQYEENFITETLPSMGKRFDRCLATGDITPFDQFGRSSDGFPIFLGRQFRAVFGKTGTLLPDASVEAVKVIRQVCFYAYKLDLPYGDVKEKSVIDSFVRTEQELRVNRLISRQCKTADNTVCARCKIQHDPQTVLAASLVQRVFADYNPAKLAPKHGPGVTANVPTHKKWTAKLSVGLPNLSGSYSLYWFNATDAMDRLNRYPTWSTSDYFTPHNNAEAKVILVPKDSRGPRLISAEPAERQFLQQGIKDEIVNLLATNALSAGHVNFVDQTVNQALALETSKTREWATLDLKDASDRVTTDLVELLFGETLLTEHLLSVRSGVSILPDGERVVLDKYAPMGSALCFPVLATCVWALSVTAVASCLGSIETALDKVYVYGDDLIVPAGCADLVIESLEKYLLKVNRDKSFIGARFAESCGMDAFDGVCVTPVRLKTMYSLLTAGKQGRVKAMVTLTAHARELQQRGFNSSAEYYYSLVEEVLGPLPYASDNSPYLGRLAEPDAWEVLQGEYIQRTGKFVKAVYGVTEQYVRTQKPLNFSAFVLKPEKVNDADTDLWAHMYRTHREWGSGQAKPTKFGLFTQPKRYNLEKRTFKGDPFSCGIYKQPEWIQGYGTDTRWENKPILKVIEDL